MRSAWRCVAVALFAVPGAASAQEEGRGSVWERLNLDRLRLTALGVEYGGVIPAKTEATVAYAVHADYGEIAPHWRVVFTATYWGSYFEPETVTRFERQLQSAVVDPAGDDTIRIGRVSVSDIALEGDMRWLPLRSAFLRPFVGGGLGVHVINAENTAIDRTFVESGLDQISTGLSGIVGAELNFGDRLSIGALGRYTLVSTVRFATARATLTYRFGRQRPQAP